MLSTATVVGVDPGLVHTGLVHLHFDRDNRSVHIRHHLVDGLNAEAARDWLSQQPRYSTAYIEDYRARSNFSTDPAMFAGVREFRAQIDRSSLLSNTGVMKIVTQDLMEALHVWSFSTSTHHQDLRSAARIGLYGMLKHPDMNELVAVALRDSLNGTPWAYQKEAPPCL